MTLNSMQSFLYGTLALVMVCGFTFLLGFIKDILKTALKKRL